ncbi:hypothetical protein [Acinetobacter modestus]|uniref:hypothetical protein n=1 Tax=Acinetobacter modestus TaxID=1776740 RepID=UPI001F4AEB38|nr:hypothetical protein [Acinetobacter modestus]MCH7330629.1 hypothetical protein [Acinetobacter modestus]
MTWKQDWQLRLSTIFWFIGIILFLCSLPIIFGVSVWGLAVIGIIAILITAIIGTLAWLIRKHKPKFFAWWLCTVITLSILLAFPIYYLAFITQLNPALIPQITLTNGKQTIIFQGMQHIATESFYKSVVYDLENAFSQDYIFMYEGVKPSSPEIDQWFNKLITGGQPLADSYELMGSICGLKFQNQYFKLLQKDMLAHPNKFVVADVDTRELKQEYERLMKSDPDFAKAMNDREQPEQSQSEVVESLIEKLRNGSESQKQMAGVLCRGIMTLVVGKNHSAKSDQQMDKLILNFRNKKIYESIINERRNKIYITYGFDHFQGTYKLLKQHDPSWKILTVKWMRTIDQPEAYEKHLEF